MKSVRLGEELEQQLEKAAQVTGQPASHIIRDGVRQRCNELLGDNLRDRLADVIGAVGSGGASSRHTGKEFTDSLKKRRTKQRTSKG